MSSSWNGNTFSCKSKVEDEIVGSRPTGCALPIKKKWYSTFRHVDQLDLLESLNYLDFPSCSLVLFCYASISNFWCLEFYCCKNYSSVVQIIFFFYLSLVLPHWMVWSVCQESPFDNYQLGNFVVALVLFTSLSIWNMHWGWIVNLIHWFPPPQTLVYNQLYWKVFDMFNKV